MPAWDLAVSTSALAHFEPSRHLPLLARCGFAAVELSGGCFRRLRGQLFAELAAAIADAGITVNSIHVPFQSPLPPGRCSISDTDPATRQQALDMAAVCLDRLQALGGRCLVLHPSSDIVPESERERCTELLRAGLTWLRTHAGAGSAVCLAVETLHRTSLGGSARDLLDIIAPLPNTNVGVCLDVNHANLTGDLVEATRLLGPRLVTLHLSDNDGVMEKHWLPLRGVIPWRAWAKVLAGASYAGPLMFEVSPREAADRGLSDDELLADLYTTAGRLRSWAQEN